MAKTDDLVLLTPTINRTEAETYVFLLKLATLGITNVEITQKQKNGRTITVIPTGEKLDSGQRAELNRFIQSQAAANAPP